MKNILTLKGIDLFELSIVITYCRQEWYAEKRENIFKIRTVELESFVEKGILVKFNFQFYHTTWIVRCMFLLEISLLYIASLYTDIIAYFVQDWSTSTAIVYLHTFVSMRMQITSIYRTKTYSVRRSISGFSACCKNELFFYPAIHLSSLTLPMIVIVYYNSREDKTNNMVVGIDNYFDRIPGDIFDEHHYH